MKKEISIAWFKKVARSCHKIGHVRALMKLYTNLCRQHELTSSESNEAWQIVKSASNKVYKDI